MAENIIIEKAGKKKSSRLFNVLFLILLGILSLFVYLFWKPEKEPEPLSHLSSTGMINSNESSPQNLKPLLFAYPLPKFDNTKDSTFESLLNELKQEIIETTLDGVLESIKEEYEKDDFWNKTRANKWYEKTLTVLKQSGQKGQKLIESRNLSSCVCVLK